MKSNISIRQAGILLVLCLLSNKVLLLPSLLFERSGADGIFSIIISFAIELILLPILIKLKLKYPNKSFYLILKENITTFGAKIILFALMVFMFIKAILTFSIVYVYFKQEIYQEEFLVLILVCMLPVITHGVLSGLRTISRTMEFFFIAVMAGFLVCLSLSLFTPISIPVFFTSSAKSIFSSSFKYWIVFDDFLLFFLILDRIELKKGQQKKLYFYFCLGVSLVIGLFFFFYAKYPVTAFMHDNALPDLLVFSVQFSAIGRLDIVAMITIMITTLFQIEIYCYGFCASFEEVFPKFHKKYAIIVFNVVFILLFTIFIGNHADIVEAAGGWFSIFAIVIGACVGVISLIISLLRRKNEEED
ncbi:MAG: GerAB/ArcD/ProY family transporter [Clostridia bacterium]|nr:GerAB/ArcD/ProY family transporter [Clostridia bacterium]